MLNSEKLVIEYVPIDSIVPYANNAKKHDRTQIDQIKNSIQAFGFEDPVGLWHNQIVEGHGRVIAAKELNITEVPCIRLDHLTDEQRKAYALAHNKLTMNTGFDFDILETELDNLADFFDMSDFGFEEQNEPEEFPETEPVAFKEYTEDMKTQYKCPKCGYEWN